MNGSIQLFHGRTIPGPYTKEWRERWLRKLLEAQQSIRRDNFVVVGAVIYNRRGEAQKTFEVVRLELTDGYWTSIEMRMSDALQRTRTELVLDSVEYDVGLTAEAFTRRELERGGR